MSNCPYCSSEIKQVDNRRPKVFCNDKCRGLNWRMVKASGVKIIKIEPTKINKIPKEKVIDSSIQERNYMLDLLS